MFEMFTTSSLLGFWLHLWHLFGSHESLAAAGQFLSIYLPLFYFDIWRSFRLD